MGLGATAQRSGLKVSLSATIWTRAVAGSVAPDESSIAGCRARDL